MTSKKVSFQEIENSDEEKGLNEFEIDDSNVQNKSRYSCFRSLRIYLLVFIFILITGLFVYYFSQNYEYDGVSARIMGHRHHRKTCEDFEFGCCEIYDKCVDKTYYLESKKIELSIYRILPGDSLKKNCPSLETLVNLYNINYHSKVHDCGKFGCCDAPIEVGCDHAMRNTLTDVNNDETVEYFNSHKKFVQIMEPKKDARGSNCDHWQTTIYDIVYSYNNHYPSSKGDMIVTFVIIIIGMMCLFCNLR